MNIKEFFEQSAGNWFAQRTSYDLQGDKADNSKSDLTITLIDPQDSQVVNLCQQKGISPDLAWQGIQTGWDTSVDWSKPKETGSNLMVVIIDQDNPSQGKIIRSLGRLFLGSCVIGTDKALTLTVEDEDIYSEERIWFASDNLRMRSSLVKMGNNYSAASFYSEVRKVPPKPQD